MLRVTHIGTSDNSGGAARAAFRLHRGLRAAGHDSRMVVGWKVEAAPEIHAVMAGGVGKRLVRRAARLVDQGLSLQYAALPWARDFLDHPFVQGAHVIHLHNLHGGFFPYRALRRLSRLAPLVWSLHDMWAMTGHCAYSYDCERWKTGCGRCPLPGEYPPIYLDTTALHWRLKDRIYRDLDATIVTGSAWMASLVKESPLLNRFELRTIPYGTDLGVFRPIDQAQARAMLRIPTDARVMLTFAVSERRKGGAFLRSALERLGMAPAPWLLVAGDRLAATPSGLPVRHVGYVDSDDLLNLCYGAADVFVLPTLAENFPLSVLDALAAGTPAVAFDVGGVAEVIRHGETGYLVAERSADGLAEALRRVLTDAEGRRCMSENARRRAEREYSLDGYTRAYVSVYEDVVRRRQMAAKRPG